MISVIHSVVRDQCIKLGRLSPNQENPQVRHRARQKYDVECLDGAPFCCSPPRSPHKLVEMQALTVSRPGIDRSNQTE